MTNMGLFRNASAGERWREASQILGHYGDDAGYHAGGTELLLATRHRALSYSHLVDLKVIPGLNTIQSRDGVIEIGAACTHREVERSSLVRENNRYSRSSNRRWPIFACGRPGRTEAIFAFAEPHSDPATLLLVLGATVHIESAAGARDIPIEKLIVGAYANHLAPGEIPDGDRPATAKRNRIAPLT